MMRISLLCFSPLVCFGADACALAQAQSSAATLDPLIIAILPEVVIDQTVVTLEQIARISGGSLELRRHVAKLDIGELKSVSERTVVTSAQVRFRLLLAGLDGAGFHLVGATRTIVRESDEPITLRKITASAEMAVRQKYPGDLGGASMSPLQGAVLPPLDIRATDRVRFEARTLSPVPVAGKARAEVTIFVNGSPRLTVPITIEIRAPEMIPLAARQTQPGYIRPVANVVSKALIKAGDRVKIVAPLGSARIEVLGEAMAEGALGDIIRVRNVESNRVVHGRIESGGFVVVEY